MNILKTTHNIIGVIKKMTVFDFQRFAPIKNRQSKIINCFIAIAAVTSLSVYAQPQRMQPYSGKSPQEVRQVIRPESLSVPVESFDDKQREEIKKIRMEQLKERTKLRNLLREKRAKLEVLQTADKPDMKEINKLIDEIAAIQAQEMKIQAASRQKIRSLLTEEQRVVFDAQGDKRENVRYERANRPERQFRPSFDFFRGQKPERQQR
jgi:Spy/CpxP family protein refolding chaperone